MSMTFEICQNQHVDFLRFLVREDSFNNKKNLELVSRPHLKEFFYKNFSCVIFHKLAKLHNSIYFSSYSVKRISCFLLTHLITA